MDDNGLIDFEHEEKETEQLPEPPQEDAEEVEDDVDLAALLEQDYEKEEEDSAEEDSAKDDPADVQENPEDSDKDKPFKNDENAQNAERRRQTEQRLMEKLRQTMPEVQLAQQLSALYGKPVDQLMADLQEAQIKQQAQSRGVPEEYIRRDLEKEQRLQQLELQVQNNEFLQWNTRVDGEMSALKTEYPSLTDADLHQAKSYLLGTLRNVDVPLKQAVLALHGEKLLNATKEAERNEALAQAAGRKANSVIPPKGKSSSDQKTLTDDERMVASEIFGMSEEDYLKYK